MVSQTTASQKVAKSNQEYLDTLKEVKKKASNSSEVRQMMAKKIQGQSATEIAEEKMNMFLRMLITQLQHQDPSKPESSSKLAMQLGNMTMVQQSVLTRKSMDKLANTIEGRDLIEASNIIGREVDVPTGKFRLDNGKSQVRFNVTKDVRDIEIMITDSENNLVAHHKPPFRDGAGDPKTGWHNFSWDGKDVEGRQQKDGIYTIHVVAYDQKKRPMDLEVMSTSVVTGVNRTNSGPELITDFNDHIVVDQINAIRTHTDSSKFKKQQMLSDMLEEIRGQKLSPEDADMSEADRQIELSETPPSTGWFQDIGSKFKGWFSGQNK